MIATRSQLGSFSSWPEAFSGERKDWRYYEIVNDTLNEPAADFRYLVVSSGAIQPFFLIDQDLLAGSGAAMQSIARAIRRLWPRFLKMRTLMVGCAAGEGHLAATAEDLTATLPQLAKEHRASLIVMKEFPARYRSALEPLRRHGFTRVPSMPMTRLNIAYEDFDHQLLGRIHIGSHGCARVADRLRRAGRCRALAALGAVAHGLRTAPTPDLTTSRAPAIG